MSKRGFKQHNLAFIGAGYVGLVSGTALAEIGHHVILVDNNKDKIARLKKGEIPIFEPGLDDLVKKNVKAGRLTFTTSLKNAVRKSDVIFIAVNTPPQPDGKADLSFVAGAAREIAEAADAYKVVVDKSTVPVQTGERVADTIKQYNKRQIDFDVVSNPEFLREGSAIEDFLKPDRIVVGVANKRAEKIMREIYSPIKAPFIATDVKSAELIKHACNSFLATKISYINAVARICELSGANIDEVAEGMGMDFRIGKHFLNAGVGYGGSCFESAATTYTLNSPHLKAKPISQLLDDHSEDGESSQNGSAVMITPHQGRTLSFDLEKKRVNVEPITVLTKRAYTGPFTTIKTKLGRTLRVTADHPVITFSEETEEFNVCPAVNVKTGDRLALALGTAELDPARPINILRLVQDSPLANDIWLRPTDDSFKDLEPPILKSIPDTLMKYPYDVRRTNCLPLKAYNYLRQNNELLEFDEKTLRLFTTKGNPTYCPAIIEPSDEIARLIGYYLAEGWITQDAGRHGKIRDRIGFAFHKKEIEYVSDVTSILTNLGIRYAKRTHENVTSISVSSRPLAFLLREILDLGTNSNNKQLPPFAFNLPESGRRALLQGLFSGDGSVTPVNKGNNMYFEYASTSPKLVDGMIMLLQSLHIVPATQKKWMNKSTRPAYHIRINGIQQLMRLPGLFGQQRQKQIDEIASRYQRTIAPTGFKRRQNFATVAVTSTELETNYQGDVYSMETGNGVLVGPGGLIVHNCFPKDVSAFISIADEMGYDFDLLKSVEAINDQAKKLFLLKIEQALWVTKGKRIAIWGLAFKPNTDDMRNAPSIDIIEKLHDDGAVIAAYDPESTDTAKEVIGKKVTYQKNKYDTLKDADALVIMTDWDEFKDPDWKKVRSLLNSPIIIDGRNMFKPQDMEKLGFVYHSVGRG